MERSGLDSSKRRLFHSIVISSLLGLSLPAIATAEVPAKLAETLDQIRRQYGVGATAYALVEGNKLIASGGLGYHSRAKQRPVTADSLFRVGSLTKALNGTAIQILASQDRLELNDPIRKYLPDIPLHNPWRKTHPVTLAMVLEHSAGLQDLSHKEFYYPDPLPLSEAFQVEPESRQVKWQPGLHHSYSNAGAGYAGRVLEVVTGEKWDQWLDQNLLQPLQMNRSGTLYSDALKRQLVVGYDSDLKSVIPYWHTLFRPFGALNTSANEFSHFLRLLINRGRWQDQQLLPATAIRRMEQPGSTLAASTGHRYGYGLGLYRYFRQGKLLIGHGGDGDGYLAHFAYNPESRRGFFVVINAFLHAPLKAMRAPLEQWVIAPVAQQQPTTIRLTAQQLDALSGRYQAVTARFPGREASQEIEISAQDGGLIYRQGANRTQLEALSGQQFRLKGESEASHIFIRHQDALFWQSDEGNFRKLP